MLSVRDLLRRPEVSYAQVAQLAQRVGGDALLDLLPPLPEPAAQEVELQVKYESYVRKQEQIVQRARRLEEKLIPEPIDYEAGPHLRTQARPKITRTRPLTIRHASHDE